jgi:hypothetical protein
MKLHHRDLPSSDTTSSECSTSQLDVDECLLSYGNAFHKECARLSFSNWKEFDDKPARQTANDFPMTPKHDEVGGEAVRCGNWWHEGAVGYSIGELEWMLETRKRRRASAAGLKIHRGGDPWPGPDNRRSKVEDRRRGGINSRTDTRRVLAMEAEAYGLAKVSAAGNSCTGSSSAAATHALGSWGAANRCG